MSSSCPEKNAILYFDFELNKWSEHSCGPTDTDEKQDEEWEATNRVETTSDGNASFLDATSGRQGMQAVVLGHWIHVSY